VKVENYITKNASFRKNITLCSMLSVVVCMKFIIVFIDCKRFTKIIYFNLFVTDILIIFIGHLRFQINES
jgi:hypothetical protein